MPPALQETTSEKKYEDFLCGHFAVHGDFPWKDESFDVSDYEVFRCPNEKWFALIMTIPFKRLGLKSDERVNVVNLKAPPEEIESLIDKRTIFPAYHMNKKHWITVVLSDQIDFERLCALTQKSWDLVE